MIKVRSLMKPRLEQRPIATQTEYGFSKFQRTSDTRTNQSYLNYSFNRTHSSINNKEADQNKLNSTAGASFFSSSPEGLLKRKDINRERKQMETKGFKFLQFQENAMREVLLRYLQGQIQYKKDQKVLSKQIQLSFFNREERTFQSNNSINSQTYIVEVPEIMSIVVSLKQIVDIVRQIFEKKSEEDQSRSEVFKKIRLTVERVISEKSYVEVSSKKDEEKRVVLRKYLQNFIAKVDKQKKKKKYGDKKFMFRFYHEIYSRYDQIPFTSDTAPQQQYESPLPILAKENSVSLGDQLKKEVMESRLKKKATINESFIKMRFYNNLRKEVEVLSTNTQNILNKEMNKLSQI